MGVSLGFMRLNFKSKTEEDMVLYALREIYPVFVIANLKKNTFHVLNEKDLTKNAYKLSTFDSLILTGAEPIPDEAEKEKFLQLFNRESLIESFKRGEGSVSFRHRRICGDGEIHWFEAKVIFRDASISDIPAICLMRTIDSEIKESMALENKTIIFKALSENFIAGYFIENDGEVFSLQYSKEAYDILFDELSLNTYSDFIQKISDEYILSKQKEVFIKSLDIKAIKSVLNRKNEAVFDFTVKTGKKNRIIRFRFVACDNKIALGIYDKESELKEKNKEQEQFKAAMEKAEAANDAKSVFLFNMSHDIRTPMNAILGFSQMAGKYIDNPAKVRDCLNKITASGEHLLKLINDVLDMSSIESGKVNLNNIRGDLGECIHSIKDIIEAEANSRRIDFSDDIKIVNKNIIFDELRLSQILFNVLGNALKYTHPGGKVSLSVNEEFHKESNSSTYTFVVKDNGIGMDPKFLKRVFDPFSREKSSTISGISGTGLGMAITKRIVDLMAGDIKIDSKQGVGTQVTVTLEFNITTDEASAVDNTSEEEVILQGKKILVVEDNEFNREITNDILSSFGATVFEATDGCYAVDMISENPNAYDAILMDIQMPIMDGYEATEKILKIKAFDINKTPIIAISANAFEEYREKAKSVGMVGFISKPIVLGELLNTLTTSFHK